jgi:hypothetical protein
MFREDRYRLWSLYDMLLFYAAKLATGTMSLAHLHGRVDELARTIVLFEAMSLASPRLHPFPESLRSILRESVGKASGDKLVTVADNLEWLPVSPVVSAQLKRLREAAKRNLEVDQMEVLLSELRENIRIELDSILCFMVKPEYRELFDQKDQPFGDDVADKFPDANRDIAAAGRCLALNENTASVFHSMRVLEHGLRALAKQFNVDFAVDSWHKVIKEIEVAINALRNTNRPGGLTDAEREQITHCSEAASQFRYFKDAWRNHVSHARIMYTEPEALSVWTHVRDFMRSLAAFV